MDYKARHLSPLTWTSDIFATVFAPEPFDKFSDSYLRQIVAPDGSIFLLIHGFYDETRSIVVSYAIEAPPSCLMRRKRVVGHNGKCEQLVFVRPVPRLQQRKHDPILNVSILACKRRRAF